MRIVFLMATAFILGACAHESVERGSAFSHEIDASPLPWPHERFDAADKKFSFAVISDLNGGEREGVFQVAVSQLNLLRPEFIISVGDLIDGGTEDVAQLEKEWDWFDERAEKLVAPLFYVGGNHDLTNQVMREVWQARYGPRYYHFVYGDVLFLMLDTEDYSPERHREIYLARAEAVAVINGGDPERGRKMEYFSMPERLTGEVGSVQAAYFEKVIADHPDVRWTFLFMHKPVWRREGDHHFTRVETALSKRLYTLINGHFHSYSHSVRHGRDYITLGTTGGGQNADNPASFDHVTMITVDDDAPSLVNLKLEGILD